MKKIMGIILVSLLLFSCSEKKPLEMTKVKGTITGFDGKPLKNSNIILTHYGDYFNSPIKIIDTDDNGNYTLDFNKEGIYSIYVTGANHNYNSSPVVFTKDGKTVTIDFKLPKLEYKDEITVVSAIISTEKFSRKSPHKFETTEDGNYILTVEADVDTLGYQLLGVTAQEGRSVNGTDSDFMKYDGGGDYISYKVKQGDKFEITLDKAMLVNSDVKPATTINCKDLENLKGVIEFKGDIESKMMKAMVAENNMEELEKIREEIINYFDKDLKAYKFDSELYSHMVSVIEMSLISNNGSMTGMDLKKFSNIVPAESPAWSVVSNFFTRIKYDDIKTNLEYITKVSDTNPSVNVKVYTLGALTRYYDNFEKNYDKAKEVFTKASELAKGNDTFRYYLLDIDPDVMVKVGKTVPPFEVELLSEDKVLTDGDFRGKYVLIDFWATWCSPCRAEMPYLHKAYEKYKDKNFEILSLSFDGKMEDVLKYREGQWKMPWLHSFIEGNFRSQIAKDFSVIGIPKPILIDPDGKILAVSDGLRHDELDATLAKYLSEN